MLVIKPLGPGDPLPRDLDARVLCGEDVSVRVSRAGYALSYLPTGATRWRSFEMTEPAREALAGYTPGAFALAAYLDETPAGLAVAANRANRWCDVLDLRVDAAYRQQGIGRMLLEACMRAACDADMAGLRMLVSDLNPVMCQFAEHMGFRVEGLDRLLWAMTPEERIKPMMRRASALIFYRRKESDS